MFIRTRSAYHVQYKCIIIIIIIIIIVIYLSCQYPGKWR